MHAQGLQLVAPGIGDRGLARVGHHDRRAVRGMERKQLQPRSDLRRLRKDGRNVLGTDRLDIGDLAVAEMRKCLRREMGWTHDRVVIHDTPLLDMPTRSSWARFHHSCSVIAIVLTTRSGSGRTRSMDSNPFLRSAPNTSIPSARTKVRWNWRAAIPRWR